MSRFNLPDIDFADKSALEIEQRLIANYEEARGEKLKDSDPRKRFLEAIVPLLVQQRVAIDYAGKQNLLSYAVDKNLDHLGTRTNTERLGPDSARVTERFNFSISQNHTISEGTRVTAGDGVFFATDHAVVVTPVMEFVDISCICTVTGTVGNGYEAGALITLVDPLPWVQSVTNISVSAGGSDVETDDAYAERIRLAPSSFSVAGPNDAYAYWAMSASPLIDDVGVTTPEAGVVEIRPLLIGGALPDEEILEKVQKACGDRTKRPMTDLVRVLSPEIVSFDISAMYWISTQDAIMESTIVERVEAALKEYIVWQRSKQGRDIDPTDLIYRLKDAGAKRVSVTGPIFQRLESHEIGVADEVSLTYGGLEDA